MPKVTTYQGVYIDENNIRVRFKEDISVTTDGEFSMGLPDLFAEFVDGDLRKNSAAYSHVTVHQRHGSRVHLRGTTLDAITKAAGLMLERYSAPVVVVEVVIMYQITGRASVYADGNGVLQPNGVGSSGGGWVAMRTDSRDMPSFGVDVVAHVVDKTTTTRGSFSKVEYTRHHAHNDEEGRGSLLNRFNLQFRTKGNLKEIPYSEKAEHFFAGAMMRIAEFAVEIENFGKDEERVIDAVENGSFGMLASPRHGALNVVHVERQAVA